MSPSAPLAQVGDATLQWIQDASPVGVVITDTELRILTWNGWLAERSGVSRDQAEGRNLLELFPDLVGRGLEKQFQAVLGGSVRILAQRFHHYLLPMPAVSGDRRMEQSASICPLLDGDVVLGTLTVIDDVTPRVISEEALRRQIEGLEVVRSQLDRALGHERDLVQTFARSFMQDCPPTIPLDVACLYYPAHVDDRVGGDFYDCIPLADGKLAIVVGDVCGKGVKAAVYTAMAKYTLRAYLALNPPPATLLQQVNDTLCAQITEPDMFMTLVFALIDPSTGKVEWVNAGHPSPVLVDGLGHIQYLQAQSPVLGAFLGLAFKSGEACMGQDSVLAFFTDGVTEATGQLNSSEDCGVGAVVQSVRSHPAAAIAQGIYEFAQKAGTGKLRDDVAIVVVRCPVAAENESARG